MFYLLGSACPIKAYLLLKLKVSRSLQLNSKFYIEIKGRTTQLPLARDFTKYQPVNTRHGSPGVHISATPCPPSPKSDFQRVE